jgi:uncharacterized protein (DUF2249 family)
MFTITNRTRISEIVRSNPESINAIASVAKPLEKLKNPLLRRIMAPRVTLAEAAAIGGCDLERLRQVLIPLGFSFSEDSSDNDTEKMENKPQWLLAVPNDKIYNFDVRPVIDGGEDPLKAIIKRFGSIQDGEVLCIINSFVPYPLISLLSKESLTFTQELNDSEHHTWFLKRTRGAEVMAKRESDRKVILDDDKSFATALAGFDEKSVKRIDVRHLQMPVPMQTILQELDALPADGALYVYHKKVPVYLLEELNNEHFVVHVLNLGEGEVRLLIYAKT